MNPFTVQQLLQIVSTISQKLKIKATKPDVIFLNTPHGNVCRTPMLSTSTQIKLKELLNGTNNGPNTMSLWTWTWNWQNPLQLTSYKMPPLLVKHRLVCGEVIPFGLLETSCTVSGVKVVIFTNSFSVADITKVRDSSIAKLLAHMCMQSPH